MRNKRQHFESRHRQTQKRRRQMQDIVVKVEFLCYDVQHRKWRVDNDNIAKSKDANIDNESLADGHQDMFGT